MVRSRSLPADCLSYIASRTRGAFTQAAPRGRPAYTNSKRFTMQFDTDPPAHSPRCTSNSTAPRRASPNDSGHLCTCFDPKQHPLIADEVPLLHLSNITIPFAFATTTRTSAYEGLTDLAEELDVLSPTLLTPCEIRSLAQSCVITTKQIRAKIQPAPRFKAIITSKDIYAAANTLSEDLVMPCDKNPGMVQIVCPRLGWFLLQATSTSWDKK